MIMTGETSRGAMKMAQTGAVSYAVFWGFGWLGEKAYRAIRRK